jgi:hypothetical protein
VPCDVIPGHRKRLDEHEDDGRPQDLKTSLLANITLSWDPWPVIGRLFGRQPEAGA